MSKIPFMAGRNTPTLALPFALVLLMLTGCAQAPRPLYHWGGYQDQLYDYFKTGGGNVEKQVIALESDVQKARSTNTRLPPGFHAHLGLLYAQLGKTDEVVKQLATEKALYPESAQHMDALIARYTGQGAKP